MMKFAVLLGFLSFVLSPATASENKSHYETLIQQEEAKVDCSNILQHIQSYFTKNEVGQSFLAVSANRFLSEVNSCGAKNSSLEIEKLQPDMQRLSQFVNEQVLILSDLSASIMEVLPSCLTVKARGQLK